VVVKVEHLETDLRQAVVVSPVLDLAGELELGTLAAAGADLWQLILNGQKAAALGIEVQGLMAQTEPAQPLVRAETAEKQTTSTRHTRECRFLDTSLGKRRRTPTLSISIKVLMAAPAE
jgi:hypothetical protein